MEVVLKKDIKPLGFKGDIVKVRPGYFRNFLSANGWAVMADKHNKELVETQKKRAVVRREQIAVNAKAIADQLKNAAIRFKEKATDKGHLYGSIDERAIVEALKEQIKIDIDRSNVELSEHIKTTGEFEISLKLNEEISAPVKIIVENA
ncbi:50S ribosomal protein L9 [Candidatus Peregrinibacteria bacterium RIFOXYA12_FULL_33_12]|nr:MAG: 50S ribosomal protein L9 [Candidatus Peregrinibacteria bacterium RIFOXYA2_FULL_33_21]OGJ44889.1 MAG: 50S ribosomal protein L9 [Candidatus Peregrinibacteria bacterium RIFOXYA12_FULL_33_12]OGJ50070.1 MAG: 50S ribosomal protein L9 [Candidatus Peregrinibacteria bacterium RIFOXYB2_FULL_33_20]